MFAIKETQDFHLFSLRDFVNNVSFNYFNTFYDIKILESISYERKKRSESVDKPSELAMILRRKNSGMSTSSNVTSISRMSENNVIRSLKRML